MDTNSAQNPPVDQAQPVNPVIQTPVSPPTPPPVVKASKFSVKAIVSTIIFLLLAGGAAAGYIYREPLMSLVSKPTPTPAPIVTITPTPDQTADWKTYKGDGFSFKYPSDFSLELSPESSDLKWINISKDEFSITINQGSMNSRRQDAYYGGFTYSKSLADSLDIIQRGNSTNLLKVGNIKLSDKNVQDGFRHYAYETTDVPEGNPLTEFIYISETDSYLISTPTLSLNNNSNKELFYQILSTFKFTDAQTIDTSNWKTITDSTFGFSFKYPPTLYGGKEMQTHNKGLYYSFTKIDCENVGEAFCGITDSLEFEITPLSTTYEEWKKSNILSESKFSDDKKWIINGIECYKQSVQEAYNVNGINAESYSFSWNQLGHPYFCKVNESFNENDTTGIVQDIYFAKDNTLYNFTLRYINNSELERVFKKIISTFKFTN